MSVGMSVCYIDRASDRQITSALQDQKGVVVEIQIISDRYVSRDNVTRAAQI